MTEYVQEKINYAIAKEEDNMTEQEQLEEVVQEEEAPKGKEVPQELLNRISQREVELKSIESTEEKKVIVALAFCLSLIAYCGAFIEAFGVSFEHSSFLNVAGIVILGALATMLLGVAIYFCILISQINKQKQHLSSELEMLKDSLVA